jgi:hypothetical protein
MRAVMRTFTAVGSPAGDAYANMWRDVPGFARCPDEPTLEMETRRADVNLPQDVEAVLPGGATLKACAVISTVRRWRGGAGASEGAGAGAGAGADAASDVVYVTLYLRIVHPTMHIRDIIYRLPIAADGILSAAYWAWARAQAASAANLIAVARRHAVLAPGAGGFALEDVAGMGLSPVVARVRALITERGAAMKIRRAADADPDDEEEADDDADAGDDADARRDVDQRRALRAAAAALAALGVTDDDAGEGSVAGDSDNAHDSGKDDADNDGSASSVSSSNEDDSGEDDAGAEPRNPVRCSHGYMNGGYVCPKCPGAGWCSAHGRRKYYCGQCRPVGRGWCGRHDMSTSTCVACKHAGVEGAGKNLCKHDKVRRKCTRCQRGED